MQTESIATNVVGSNPVQWRSVLDTTLYDKIRQWFATGWWFSPGTPASSTNETDRHDITEILLKVVLSTTKPTNQSRNKGRHIESNTGKSVRQGNLRHPRVRFQSFADECVGDFPVLHFLPVFDFISHFHELFLVSCLFMHF